MNRLFAIALVAGALTLTHAHAQSGAPDFPAPAPAAPAAARPVNPRLSPEAKAREERRQRMSPEEARRDQQMEILESRAGGTSNTSFSRGASQARQYDRSGGGFMVRKFKDKTAGTSRQKRGQTHAMGGSDPKGERLVDKRRKKHFLFF